MELFATFPVRRILNVSFVTNILSEGKNFILFLLQMLSERSANKKEIKLIDLAEVGSNYYYYFNGN
jgi:hypothetical protein